LERRARSLIKMLTWRLLATGATWLIAFVFTESYFISSEIAIVELFVKLALYYLHERLWSKVGWGYEGGRRFHHGIPSKNHKAHPLKGI